MGPRCSSAETQVCHKSYIIAATFTLPWTENKGPFTLPWTESKGPFTLPWTESKGPFTLPWTDSKGSFTRSKFSIKNLVKVLTDNWLKENFVKVIRLHDFWFGQSLIKVSIPSYLLVVNSKTNNRS
jgi:hypothetical protein